MKTTSKGTWLNQYYNCITPSPGYSVKYLQGKLRIAVLGALRRPDQPAEDRFNTSLLDLCHEADTLGVPVP